MAVVFDKLAIREASRLCGESAQMDAVADMVAAKAKANAAAHFQTGDYINSIEVEDDQRPVVRDRLVMANDWAAKSIEYGHAAKRSTKREGPSRWVPGQFIMTETFNGL